MTEHVQLARTRDDGWPLCPVCVEDELASDWMIGWNGDPPRPTVAECFQMQFFCYACGWRGKLTPAWWIGKVVRA